MVRTAFAFVILVLVSSGAFAETMQPNPDSIPFAPAVDYTTGDVSMSVFCADLDGDSDFDLAVANSESNNVSILKNNGDGTFQTKVEYGAGTRPLSVFCADLDGDLDLDLALANYGSNDVSILKNNGDGTFQTRVDYETEGNPISVFCADLDGDLDLDLAAANHPYESVSILKNNGDGTFQTKVDYGVGYNPWSLFCADLDGDSDFDLAVANHPTDNVSILKNNGDGTFQTKVDYGAGTRPSSVFCADLDGDSDFDLAVANEFGDNVSILKNNGNGTFQTEVSYGAGDGARSVFCADLDGDSDFDLAVANWDSNCVSILINLTNESVPFYFVHITDPHVRYDPIAYPHGKARWFRALNTIRTWYPAPDFVLCSGDLVDFGATFYPGYFSWQALLEPLHEQGGTFYLDLDHSIPIHFCPGNHDAATWPFYWPPSDFSNYYAYVGPDYYSERHKNCALFSMNSGKDEGFWPDLAPEGDGLGDQYGNEITQLVWDLDVLDGVYNGTDNSEYVKTIMMHHPYKNPKEPRSDTLNMAFANERDSFINACIDYGVNLFLCGHIHNGGDWGIRNRYAETWHEGDGPQFVITNAMKESFSYRKITVTPGDKALVEVDSMRYFGSTICFGIDCEAAVHVYDQHGNHDGPTGKGDIEILIPGSTYSRWVSDTLAGSPVYTEFSVYKEDTTSYSFAIEGLGDDTMNVTVNTYLEEGIWSKAAYDSIPIYEGSVATLQAAGSILDYTMTILDPDSSEREVTPSGWEGNLPPLEPAIPSGSTNVVTDDSFAFVTSTTDPENEEVFYTFDWGDGTNSAWQGPFASGDTCVAYHIWTASGSYNLRARAIDVWDHMSNWSDTLSVTVISRGDPNADGVIDVADVVYLVNYLYRDGDPPMPEEAGDANCDGTVNVGDVVRLVNYLYRYGDAPGCP